MRVIIQKYVRPIIIPSLLNLAGSASLLCAFHTQGNKVSLAANISQFGSQFRWLFLPAAEPHPQSPISVTESEMANYEDTAHEHLYSPDRID